MPIIVFRRVEEARGSSVVTEQLGDRFMVGEVLQGEVTWLVVEWMVEA